MPTKKQAEALAENGNVTPNGQAPAPQPDPSVDQIRSILFGEQMRAYDAQLADLSERLTQEVHALGTLSEKERGDLSATIAREVTALNKRMSGDFKALETRLDELTTRLTETEAALRTQLTDAETALRHSKTDRQSLAELFTHVAAQLREDPADQ